MSQKQKDIFLMRQNKCDEIAQRRNLIGMKRVLTLLETTESTLAKLVENHKFRKIKISLFAYFVEAEIIAFKEEQDLYKKLYGYKHYIY